MVFVRVDNRLVHGQVTEAWMPFLKASCLIVANDELSRDPLRKTILAMAAPKEVEVIVESLDEAVRDLSGQFNNKKGTILIFATTHDALEAYNRGLKFTQLNLGNIHYSEGKEIVSPSIALSRQDIDDLMNLQKEGVEIEIKAVPYEKPLHLGDILKKDRSR